MCAVAVEPASTQAEGEGWISTAVKCSDIHFVLLVWLLALSTTTVKIKTD